MIVSHDLSASGAPKLVQEIAVAMLADGWAITVLSPVDGPFRDSLVAAGAAVIVAPELAQQGSVLLRELALRADADAMICNTVATDAAVRALAARVPTLWYIHEVSLLEDRLAAEPDLADALRMPALLWAGSDLPAAILRGLRDDIAVVPYGLDPLGDAPPPGGDHGRPLTLGLFGSYELRKGQDLAVAAMGALSGSVREQLRLVIYGRPLDPAFADSVRATASTLPNVVCAGDLTAEAYGEAVLGCDGVLVASRDDTLPLVSLDALGAGRVLLCTPTTGTSAALASGVSGFVAADATTTGIAAMLEEAAGRRADWPAIGEAGRAVFATRFSKAAFEDALRLALATLTARIPA